MYICPMHPDIRRDMPGRCPECGMNLVPIKASPKKHGEHKMQDTSTSFDKAQDESLSVGKPFDPSSNLKVNNVQGKHAGHHTEDFLKKFWVTLLLTIPILGYSDIFQIAFGFTLPQFAGVEWLIAVLGSIVFWYGGWVFLQGARREIAARLPGMMTLIALAITAAYLFSIYATIAHTGHTLFWELSTLIAIMLLGHWFEMRAVKSASGALRELAKLLPDTAEVLRNGSTVIVPLSELQAGDN